MAATLSRLVALIAGVSLAAGGLLLGSAGPSQAVPGAKVFPGTGFGAIADGGAPCSPSPGTPRDVTFNVTGMGAAAPADVRVTGLSLSHTFLGDLTVTLIAPDGTQKVLFGRTGATADGVSVGDNSNLAGPYEFADDAAGNWWTAATTANDTTAIPAGAYRSSAIGGTGSTGVQTQLTPAFAGVTHPNGAWTLRFVDVCAPVAGAVTAATLELVPSACVSEAKAVELRQAQAAAGTAAVAPAVAAAAAADQAAQDATPAVEKATKAVTKTKKALQAAKDSGNAAKVKMAKKKLAKAKKKLKAARTVLATAQQAAATAHQKLAAAQAAAASAQAQLTAAQSALVACQDP